MSGGTKQVIIGMSVVAFGALLIVIGYFIAMLGARRA